MADDFASRCVIAAVVFASVLFLLFFPPFLVTLWERRLVWPYLPADEYDGKLPSLTGPAGAANDALAARGFARLDTLYTPRGTGYRVRDDFWLSADGAVLAIVVGGRCIGSRLDVVWLTSRLADGRNLVTLNNLLGSEPDLTGVRQEVVVQDAETDELLARHAARLGDGGELMPYPAEDPLAEHAEVWRGRVARLVAGGYAGYLDDEETAWRYSAKGAALLTVKLQFALWKTVIRDAFQRKRKEQSSCP
jgi:hypothetical protein